MRRLVQDLLHRPHFNELPRAHNRHALGHLRDNRQAVRDEVFKAITKRPFSIQATIMEKSKAMPHVRSSKPRFYQYGYFYHFKHGASKQLPKDSEALVTTASLGTRKERTAFEGAVDDVMFQTNKAKKWKTDFIPCHADPCLQVADYCAWAVQRKWESDGKDVRSYDLIKDRLTYEYDLWSHGTSASSL